MLGDELVLFRGKDGNVVALNEWCPHRGARLSRGFCEFEGTVTCPYHGYTFDETGKCVAGLIENTKSPLIGKMRTRKYPTAEWKGIVFIWMGQTEPVPLEEDFPWEFKDATINDRRYTRVKDWEVNWTEPVNQASTTTSSTCTVTSLLAFDRLAAPLLAAQARVHGRREDRGGG